MLSMTVSGFGLLTKWFAFERYKNSKLTSIMLDQKGASRMPFRGDDQHEFWLIAGFVIFLPKFSARIL